MLPLEVSDRRQLGPHAVELRNPRRLRINAHPEIIAVGPDGARLVVGQRGEASPPAGTTRRGPPARARPSGLQRRRTARSARSIRPCRSYSRASSSEAQLMAVSCAAPERIGDVHQVRRGRVVAIERELGLDDGARAAVEPVGRVLRGPLPPQLPAAAGPRRHRPATNRQPSSSSGCMHVVSGGSPPHQKAPSSDCTLAADRAHRASVSIHSRRVGWPAEVHEVTAADRRHVDALGPGRGQPMDGVHQRVAMGHRDAVRADRRTGCPAGTRRRRRGQPRQERRDARRVARRPGACSTGRSTRFRPPNRARSAGGSRARWAAVSPVTKVSAARCGDRAAVERVALGTPARTPAGPALPGRECRPGGRSGTARRPGMYQASALSGITCTAFSASAIRTWHGVCRGYIEPSRSVRKIWSCGFSRSRYCQASRRTRFMSLAAGCQPSASTSADSASAKVESSSTARVEQRRGVLEGAAAVGGRRRRGRRGARRDWWS